MVQQEKETYGKFCESYKKSVAEAGIEFGNLEFLRVFVKIAWKLRKLEIIDCFVDVGKKKRIVDFNILLPNDMFISVCRYLDSTGQVYELEGGGEVVVDDETVFYSIERKEKTLSIGIIHLDEFIEKMLAIQRDFSKIEEKDEKIAGIA